MLLYDLYREFLQHKLLTKVYVEGICTEIFTAEPNQQNKMLDFSKQQWHNNSLHGISRDSRQVDPQDIFVCIARARFDGHEVAGSLNAGVILSERDVLIGVNGIVFVVHNTRKAMGVAAALLHNKPCNSIFSIGLTGTNGKTTTVSMIEQLCNILSIPVGTIGTMGHKIKGVFTKKQDGHTTPESPFLQSLLADMKEQGCPVVAMEVSSIGLDMERLAGMNFDVAGFSNFSRDHLGFHETMQNYALAKQKLFTHHLRSDSISVINCDDEQYQLISQTNPNSNSNAIFFGKTAPATKSHCQIVSVQHTKKGLITSLQYQGEQHDLLIPLIGIHNLYNALLAFLSLKALEKKLHQAGLLPENNSGGSESFQDFSINILEKLQNIRGRLEKPIANRLIFIDYAHTPDALAHALQSVRELREEANLQSKIWLVFGCGGDRDRGKRSDMGKISCDFADVIVVTSDNPRSEDPQSIVDEIYKGITKKSINFSILDRHKAICFSISKMEANDILLIAGKGHETYQEIAGKKIPFDDVQVVKSAILMHSEQQEGSIL